MTLFDINNPNLYIVIVLALINTIFMCFVAHKFMHIIQICGYNIKQYMAWVKDTKAKWISRVAFLSLLSFIAMFVCNVIFRDYGYYKLITYIGLIFYFWFMLVFIVNMKNVPEKKKFVITRRVLRIYSLFFIIMAGLSFGLLVFSFDLNTIFKFSLIAITPILIPILLPVCVLALLPLEKLIGKMYLKLATKQLEKAEPIIKIGITGSFGKTSTKSFLKKILEKKYEVVCTPESYNTKMGISKTINKYIKKNTQIFICEMGADHVGDIKDICDFVKPNIGVITALGNQHLLTFGNFENIVKTKYELIESLPHTGVAFFNTNNENVKQMYEKSDFLNKYESNFDGDIKVKNVHINRAGIKFDLVYDDKIYNFKTQILGEQNLQNILLCINIAIYLKVDIDDIKDAVANLTPVNHRLELKQNENGVTILDDSFNSNEAGTLYALKTLALFKKNRKIVATPGLVELGDKEEQANYEFGKNIAEYADICIIINKYNKESIKKGLLDNNFNKDNIYEVESLFLATELFKTLLQPNDVVLLENDLPDNYR